MTTKQMDDMDDARRRERLNPKIISRVSVPLDHETTVAELCAALFNDKVPAEARVILESIRGQGDSHRDSLVIFWED